MAVVLHEAALVDFAPHRYILYSLMRRVALWDSHEQALWQLWQLWQL